jgi:hypothetical protein
LLTIAGRVDYRRHGSADLKQPKHDVRHPPKSAKPKSHGDMAKNTPEIKSIIRCVHIEIAPTIPNS